MPAAHGFGLQVSAQRLDDLDRLALQAAARGPFPVHALDLGCGEGVVSCLLARAGATVVAIDRQDYETSVLNRASVCGEATGSVRFVRMVLPRPFAGWLTDGPRWSLVYSQRMLHYLRWEEAFEVLSLLRHHVSGGGCGLFLGVSGMASELSQDYQGLGVPLRNRYAQLDPAQLQRHGISEPVCLYSQSELVDLVEATGFWVQRVWTSDFGNVKLVAHTEKREDDGGT